MPVIINTMKRTTAFTRIRTPNDNNNANNNNKTVMMINATMLNDSNNDLW